MEKHLTVLGLFKSIEYVSKSIKPLEDIGIEYNDTIVMSSAPYPDGTLYEHEPHLSLGKYAMTGCLIGVLFAVLLVGGTQYLMNLNVTGMDPVSYSPIGILCYEFGLLGAVVGTFGGMMWLQGLPDWTDRAYDKEIHNGKIGLLIRCKNKGDVTRVIQIMKDHSVISIREGRDDF